MEFFSRSINVMTEGRVTRRSLVGRGTALGLGFAVASSSAHLAPSFAQEIATPATGTLADVAIAFLSTLDAEQQAAVLFDWSDTAQKQRWSNFPTGGFDRDGIMWADLADDARQAWLLLMQSAMSPAGYARVMAEWEAEQILADEKNGSGGGNGGRGGGMMFGTDYYWVALIGEPSPTDPWQIQFGGHHIAVNITVQGDQIAYTPAFVGVQWATWTDEAGATIRPLGDMEDDAFALINLLDEAQQQVAILGNEYIQLTLGPGPEGDGQVLDAAGITGAAMTDAQQEIFLRLIGHYVDMGLDSAATARMATVTGDLNDTSFAWFGPTTQGEPAYFRIVGPTVNIEYSPQQVDNDPVNHIHAIYRDPTDLYGSSFTGLTIA